MTGCFLHPVFTNFHPGARCTKRPGAGKLRVTADTRFLCRTTPARCSNCPWTKPSMAFVHLIDRRQRRGLPGSMAVASCSARHEAAGSRAACSRVSTRGFLCDCQARRAGLIPSGRRPAKRTAARGRGFACSTLPGFHPGLLGRVTRPIPNSKDLQNNVRKRIPAAAFDAARCLWGPSVQRQGVGMGCPCPESRRRWPAEASWSERSPGWAQ